ncbi:PDDEXK family nuclease [Lignipirellula cremea]|uniref:DUF91 domain-containing protein n=1 Tax=Lignipirellula cremea TaxID=2528010 RepID=A0A518DN81_9BACT|nr:hypothetical protein [Lignipirellula cremea]QDU93292.1 hypothetical protein Pla8534_10720 [Lignipirellula cremea]
MQSPPLLLNSLQDPGRRLVRLQSEPHDPKNEAWLQELLYAHPELLPTEEFDDAFAKPVPIGREVPTARGPIDNLYLSPAGGITVVETKLWKNPEKHRTVVAQIIDYAKELAAWDYDQLCAAVLNSSRRRKETGAVSLEEKMQPALAQEGLPLHEFQENTAACLSAGRFLLLIVGDRVSPNIALLTQAIQSAPGLSFTLGLAEMKLYEVQPGQDWPLLVVPEVIGKTVEKIRGVVQVQYTQEKPRVRVDVVDTEVAPPSPVDGFTLETFLEAIPDDLKQTYLDAIQAWKQIGGSLLVRTKTLYFAIELAGQTQRVIRCRPYQVTVLREKQLDEWTGDPHLFPAYLEALQAAPVVQRSVREDRLWIDNEKFDADSLAVLFAAATQTIQQAKEAE